MTHAPRRPDDRAHEALPLSLRAPTALGANDGDHRAALALTVVGRWCVAALAALAAGVPLPDLAPILAALATAVALNSAAALDALAAELMRWCESASADPYDPDAMGPLMLAACDASALAFHAARDLSPDITAHAPDAVDLSAPPRRSEAVEGGESADASDPDAGEHRR